MTDLPPTPPARIVPSARPSDLSHAVLPCGRASFWSLLLGLLLLPGCGADAGPDVAPGRYRLFLTGSLTDTLRGPARLQVRTQGHAGLELGPRTGPGGSIELVAHTRPDAPEELRPGRYEVVDTGLYPLRHRADASRPAEALVVLSTRRGQFIATEGHLTVTRLNAETVDARLRVEMRRRHGASSVPRTVRVTGVLRAAAP